jgi:hypothetical protein
MTTKETRPEPKRLSTLSNSRGPAHYYGFKGHLTVDRSARIVHFTLTAANIDERQILPNLFGRISGWRLGDKGDLGKQGQAEAAAHGLQLGTPVRSNMDDPRDPTRKSYEGAGGSRFGRMPLKPTLQEAPDVPHRSPPADSGGQPSSEYHPVRCLGTEPEVLAGRAERAG